MNVKSITNVTNVTIVTSVMTVTVTSSSLFGTGIQTDQRTKQPTKDILYGNINLKKILFLF